MRVAFVTQWYNTQGGLINGIARSLQRQGARVATFSGLPENRQARSLPSRRHGVLGRRSNDEGVAVVRYPMYWSHDHSALRRFATYGTFAASSLDAIADLRRADVVLAYCSPATAASAALLARRLGGAPYVLMIQDVWPDSVFATGFVNDGASRKLAELALGTYLKWAYSGASQITTLSPGMRDLLVSRGANPERTHVIYNWTDEAAASRVTPPVRRNDEPLHLMYAGNMGTGQDLGNVLAAMALLPRDQIRLSLVGGGAAERELRELSSRLGLSNVRFVERQPVSEMPSLLSTAHMHLVSLADTELFRITLPSKLQALMAAGLPILAVAPGEVASIVEHHRVGLVSKPSDPGVLAAVLRRALATPPADLATMGQRGSALYFEQMSEAINADRLLKVLQAAAREG